MKTSALLCLWTTLFAQPVLAQITPAWSRFYDAPGPQSMRPKRMIATPDGGVISLLVTSDLSAPREIVATKFTENGEIGWQFSRTTQGGLGIWEGGNPDGAVDAQGNLYLVYGDVPVGQLLKISPAGVLLWQTDVTSSLAATSYTNHLVLDSQGLPIVVGAYDILTYPYVALYKFSANGTLIDSTASQAGIAATEVAIGPSDEVLVFGAYDWYFGGTQFYGKVARFDANGDFDWIQTVVSDGYATICCGTFWGDRVEHGIVDDQGNSYSIVNGSFGSEWYHDGWVGFSLYKIDPTGFSAYRGVVDSPRSTYGVQVAVDGAGSAYVVGSESWTDFGNDTALAVWKLDTMGQLVWTFKLAPTVNQRSYGSAIGVTPQGNILVTGHRTGVNQGGLDLLLDTNGNELWRRERLGETQPPPYTTMDRDRVLTEVSGHLYTMRGNGQGVTISKYVPGSDIGTQYCGPAVPNSLGISAEIDAVGEALVSQQNLTLQLSGILPGTLALILASQTQGSAPMLGGGQGTLCLGGALGRFNNGHQIRVIQANGTSSFRVDMQQVPSPTGPVPIQSGQTWNFQAWYRDTNPTSTSNLTNAVMVVFP